MKSYRIAVLPGDGIGPDVISEALRVLRAVEQRLTGVSFDCKEISMGAGEYLRSGDPLPPASLEACKQCDAILLGAMGLPGVRWPTGTEMTPQIDIREILDLYAGVRPIRLMNPSHSPLRGYAAGEIDLLILRESTEGLFAARKGSYQPGADQVCDTMRITRHASERLFRHAFRLATGRRGRVTLVDKANVLPSMAYFRSIFDEISREFPEVGTDCVYVDAAALYLVKDPRRFDVMVMENMFGDILSDLAAGLIGGMGMAPSADIGDRYAVFQPSHGSAPDIAGKGIANPVATILSAAMMLDWLAAQRRAPDLLPEKNRPPVLCGSYLEDADETRKGAAMIRAATERALADPACATPDLGGKLKCSEVTDRILAAL